MRPKRAVDTIRQTLATSQGYSLELIIVTENPAVRDAVSAFLRGYDGDNLDSFQALYQEQERVAAQYWNDGLRVSRGEYVAIWNDDLWPHPGWLDRAMPYFDRFPGRVGYVGFNDLIHDGNLLTAVYIAHRQYIIEYQGGVLGYPHYKKQFIDTESWARARKAGLWVWAEDAIVEHLHPCVGKREMDQYDQLNAEAFAGDWKTYREHEALGFPDDFEPVITQ